MRNKDVEGNSQRERKQVFSRLEAQRLLGVANRRVWRQQLETVGIDPDSKPELGWADIKKLLALHLFLRAGNGCHSKAQFKAILDQGLLEKMCQRFDIDLGRELEKLKKNITNNGKTRKQYLTCPNSCRD